MLRALSPRAVVSDDDPLLQLLRELKERDYRFVAVTPATHALVCARPIRGPPTLRDVFGWNSPFAAAELDPSLLAVLDAASAVEACEGALRSRVRVASLGEDLFLHSAFPTDQPGSVFFGPDTYRFARFICEQLPRLGQPSWVVDMGAGTGAGGIVAGRLFNGSRVSLVDVNPAALSLSAINASAAGVAVDYINADQLPAGADLVIANPPYMMDAAGRAYRDGGGVLGGAVALEWAKQALAKLAPGGSMVLYTGASYVGGTAPLLDALRCACDAAGAALAVEELDPDVFGEELRQPAYSAVERIAAIGAVISFAEQR